MRDQTEPPTVKRRFQLVPFEEIRVSRTSSYLVRGIIPREGLVVIWGAPKSGKTFWALDLTMHIALGWQYRSRRTKAGTVCYIIAEGERGMAARVEAFRQDKLQEARGAVPFYMLPTRLDLAADYPMLIADVRAALGEGGCEAIVIDTLNRSIGGSESDDEVMGAYVRAADALREAFQCAVIIIHHCGTNTARPRGHTSLTGAADAQIAVSRDADEAVVATVEFMKDGEAGTVIRSRLKVVELDEPDEDGEPITSCVIDAIDGDQPAAKRKRNVTGAAKVMLDLLGKAVADAGEIAPASNHIPQTVRVVRLELLRKYAYEGALSETDKPDAKRKAFSRSITKLQSEGLIGFWGDYVWLP